MEGLLPIGVNGQRGLIRKDISPHIFKCKNNKYVLLHRSLEKEWYTFSFNLTLNYSENAFRAFISGSSSILGSIGKVNIHPLYRVPNAFTFLWGKNLEGYMEVYIRKNDGAFTNEIFYKEPIPGYDVVPSQMEGLDSLDESQYNVYQFIV